MITKTILEKTINWTPFLWLLNENYGKTNKVFVNSFRKLKTRSAENFSSCFYNILFCHKDFLGKYGYFHDFHTLWKTVVRVIVFRSHSDDGRILRESEESDNSAVTGHKQIKYLQRQLIISVIGFTADLTMAINWAPPGILWSQKLSIGTVGFLGTISSLCELYKYFNRIS